MRNTPIFKPINTCKSLGGKANNLMLLEEMDLSIPRWVVIPKQFMQAQLNAKLNETNLVNVVDGMDLSTSILDELKHYFGTDYKDLKYAVRSSAEGEDGTNHSFAGQYETKLNVPYLELLNSIKEVWKSVVSDHVLAYRKKNNLEDDFGITVIIQEMVQPEISGVAFGLDPLTGDTSKKVVSAVYGLGEGLVSGQLKADNYTISNQGIKKDITSKEFLLQACESGTGNRMVSVDQVNQNNDTLKDQQLHEISDLLEALNDKT